MGQPGSPEYFSITQVGSAKLRSSEFLALGFVKCLRVVAASRLLAFGQSSEKMVHGRAAATPSGDRIRAI